MHMSPRNFARAYAADRKRTPAKAVEAIRVDAARRALEHTSDRIELVARRCGFSDEEQMRSAFMRQLGVSPRSYRERFPGKIARPPRHAVSWRIEAGRAPGRLN
jgi:transcriptional regulator GlxA family with amidase domain